MRHVAAAAAIALVTLAGTAEAQETRAELQDLPPAEHLPAMGRVLARLDCLPLSRRLVDRLERYLTESPALTLRLSHQQPTTEPEA